MNGMLEACYANNKWKIWQWWWNLKLDNLYDTKTRDDACINERELIFCLLRIDQSFRVHNMTEWRNLNQSEPRLSNSSPDSYGYVLHKDLRRHDRTVLTSQDSGWQFDVQEYILNISSEQNMKMS